MAIKKGMDTGKPNRDPGITQLRRSGCFPGRAKSGLIIFFEDFLGGNQKNHGMKPRGIEKKLFYPEMVLARPTGVEPVTS